MAVQRAALCSAGPQVWESGGWIFNTDTYHTGSIRFRNVADVYMSHSPWEKIWCKFSKIFKPKPTKKFMFGQIKTLCQLFVKNSSCTSSVVVFLTPTNAYCGLCFKKVCKGAQREHNSINALSHNARES